MFKSQFWHWCPAYYLRHLDCASNKNILNIKCHTGNGGWCQVTQPRAQLQRAWDPPRSTDMLALFIYQDSLSYSYCYVERHTACDIWQWGQKSELLATCQWTCCCICRLVRMHAAWYVLYQTTDNACMQHGRCHRVLVERHPLWAALGGRGARPRGSAARAGVSGWLCRTTRWSGCIIWV
jgi:hypothetical protein